MARSRILKRKKGSYMSLMKTGPHLLQDLAGTSWTTQLAGPREAEQSIRRKSKGHGAEKAGLHPAPLPISPGGLWQPQGLCHACSRNCPLGITPGCQVQGMCFCVHEIESLACQGTRCCPKPPRTVSNFTNLGALHARACTILYVCEGQSPSVGASGLTSAIIIEIAGLAKPQFS